MKVKDLLIASLTFRLNKIGEHETNLLPIDFAIKVPSSCHLRSNFNGGYFALRPFF